ncbi:MAG TPA: M23 family metallopeptidase [Candidatus Paceibacterota bacterium]|nr:M23 family metallopeptidase [Candidatus Paceibacterota bacterium]
MTITWPLPGLDVAIPQEPDHPGSFAAVRKYDIHTGVDLYAPEGQQVVAIEDGVVVFIDRMFTGGEDTPKGEDGEPVWLQTAAIGISGKSGVILYGELTLVEKDSCGFDLDLGSPFKAGDVIGTVKRVLKDKPDGRTFQNPAESPSMLHLELYRPRSPYAAWWRHGEPRPRGLRDPTELLLKARERM